MTFQLKKSGVLRSPFVILGPGTGFDMSLLEKTPFSSFREPFGRGGQNDFSKVSSRRRVYCFCETVKFKRFHLKNDAREIAFSAFPETTTKAAKVNSRIHKQCVREDAGTSIIILSEESLSLFFFLRKVLGAFVARILCEILRLD